jgi:hypothetical protein
MMRLPWARLFLLAGMPPAIVAFAGVVGHDAQNLAPNGGNTVGAGFAGNQTGANPPPAAFPLNGTGCATTYSF